MPFETIDPDQAHELMTGELLHVYLDVRSVPEFEQGHAPGALNVPILHLGPGGMTPNPEFLAVVKANVASDTPLVVGCKMGGRSARACEVLAQAGYTTLHNIDGGFGGRPDAATEAARRGWQAAGLPVTTDSPSTYDVLKAKA